MKKILNITNGDSAVHIMQQAGIPGVFLPWRDVLHDGPVPADLSLETLSEERAQFIIDSGLGEPEFIRQSFMERDHTLKSFERFDKVILWFEHDLYDQLQILQILDWFSYNKPDKTVLAIICVDQYLGMLTPDEMNGLFVYEEEITEKQLILAKLAWSAFRSETPEKWCDLLKTDTSALPFLRGAIARLIEEYPSCNNGLSRTEKVALEIITQGETRPGKIFANYQETEQRRFLGDSSFWGILNNFLQASPPLLLLAEGLSLASPPASGQELLITDTGKAVLKGEQNWLDINASGRWIGGVHLTKDNFWCRHMDSGLLVQHTG